MADTPKGIRNLNLELWRRFREYAQYIGVPVGHLLNDLIAAFLKDKKP